MELVRRSSALVVTCVSQLIGSDHAVSNLEVRDLNHFLTDLCFEAQIELRLVHSGNIVERAVLTILATLFVVHGLAVLFRLLTYIGNRLTDYLLTLEFEDRSNSENTFLSEFLLRESTDDLSVHFVTNLYQRTRVNTNLLGVR